MPSCAAWIANRIKRTTARVAFLNTLLLFFIRQLGGFGLLLYLKWSVLLAVAESTPAGE